MIKDWFMIDGQNFNINVLEITESASVLYSDNTGRTLAKGAPITLDPLGTFYNYKVKVKRHGDEFDDYDKLYMHVTKPRYTGYEVKIVHNQTTWTFNGYISSAERTLSRIDEKNNRVYWKEMTLNIIATEAQVLPV